jgi:hypothetical protein
MDYRRDRSTARPRRAVLAIGVAAAVVMLAACSTAVPPRPTPQAPQAPHSSGTSAARDAYVPRSGSMIWMLTRAALAQLVADPSTLVQLASAQVYEILQPGQKPLAGFAADTVVTFTSASTLETAVNDNQIPAGTYGVLYDPEAWDFTPLAEQQDPVQAATQAAAAAHAHGLRLIVTPALNLASVLAPSGNLPRWQQFLDLNLIGSLAKVADVVELQAQSLERDSATYSSFVQAAAQQARAAKPGIGVLAGLSTNPPGAVVDSQQLTAAIQATKSLVDGYWLNIPGQGPRCPTCNPANPGIAVQTLLAVS